MTVADYLRELPEYPVYLHTPAGPMRVVGVVSKGDRLPFVRCVAPSGQVIEWAVLYSTELMEEEEVIA